MMQTLTIQSMLTMLRKRVLKQTRDLKAKNGEVRFASVKVPWLGFGGRGEVRLGI